MPAGRTIVDDVDVLGTDQVSEDDVLDKIATEPTSTFLGLRLPWTSRSLLDTHVLERDVRRVARYYRSRGFYDARVVSSEIVPDDDEVDIQIAVQEGQPVLVRKLQVAGLGSLPVRLRSKVRARIQLDVGEPFDEGLYDGSKERVLRSLRNEGYARSGVAGHVVVAGDEHLADVLFTVRPGPICTFRTIRITGLVDVRASRVRVAMGIERGDKFSDTAVENAQSSLFGLGVFQSVSVKPVVDEDDPFVDLEVEVTEADFGRFRLGGGLSADRNHTNFHLTTAWEHRNLFGGLQRLTISNKPGLSISPSVFSPDTLGFDNTVSVDFAWPGIPERRTTFLHRGSYAAGLDTAANICRHDAKLSTGLARPLAPWLRATISHELQLFVPVDGNLVFACPDSAEQEQAREVYSRVFLSYLSETLVIDRRDDPFNTRRGGYAALTVSETPPGLVSDLGFVSVVSDVRGYLAPNSWLGFAGRFLVARAFAIPGDKLLPPQLRFFSGGGSSVRGYDTRTIGAYECYDLDAPDCPSSGGDVQWELSAEIRAQVIGPFGVVGFLDMGDVYLTTKVDDPEQLDLRRHHASIGLGIRLKTIVGPIRFDVAGRLRGRRRPEETPGEQDFLLFKAPVTLHFALGEAY